MAINNTVTITGFDPATGVKDSLRGTGDTRAHALAELITRAAMTVMTPVRGSESAALPAADFANVIFATGEFADAELTLTKGLGYSDKVIRLKNVTKAIRLANSKGLIDITNALVVAFAGAYYDGDGVTGYTPVSGRFVE